MQERSLYIILNKERSYLTTIYWGKGLANEEFSKRSARCFEIKFTWTAKLLSFGYVRGF